MRIYRREGSYWHLVKRQNCQVDVSVFMLLQLNAFSCFKNVDINSGIMFKCILKKWAVTVWTGFN